MKIRVGHLYPDYLNIYADRGNIAVLAERAARRGHELEVTAIGVAYAGQEVASVPRGPRDQALDLIATERETIHPARHPTSKSGGSQQPAQGAA